MFIQPCAVIFLIYQELQPDWVTWLISVLWSFHLFIINMSYILQTQAIASESFFFSSLSSQ